MCLILGSKTGTEKVSGMGTQLVQPCLPAMPSMNVPVNLLRFFYRWREKKLKRKNLFSVFFNFAERLLRFFLPW